MSYADIAIIAILLLFALIGLAKGFFKTFIGFFGTILAIAAAFFLTKTVVTTLMDVEPIGNFVNGTLSKMLGGLLVPKSLAGLGDNATQEQITEALKGGYLSFAAEPLSKALAPLAASGMSVAQAAGAFLAKTLFTILVGLGVFLVARLVLVILTMILNAATRDKTINGLNRLFGFIFGAVKGALFISVVLLFSSVFTGILPAVVQEEIDKSLIAKPATGFVYGQVSKYIDVDNFFDKLTGKTHDEEDEEEHGNEDEHENEPDEENE